MQRADSAKLTGRDEFVARLTTKLTRELGDAIIAHLGDDKVIEIMLNPDGTLWVERLGEPMKQFGSMARSQALSMMATVASSLDTQITAENPILECELPLDGSRFEALVPPVVSGPTFTIRKKAVQIFTLEDYVTQGIMTPKLADVLSAAVRSKRNILVCGGTGTGKTTLTNAIIHEISTVAPDHRLAIIEDTGELQCASENAVIMRATDRVDMTRLLKATLRLRPDRILVGEVRDGAALALLKAWNTGHPGGAATVHANSAVAALVRMEQLVAEAVQGPMQTLIAEAVNIVVSIEKTPDGRRVREVVEVVRWDGQNYETRPIDE
jgi:P-type conjugative transfer ATPase TrbB